MKIDLSTGAASIAVALALMAGAAQAQSRLVVGLAGEAYDGPPTFEVRMGESTLGSGVLTRAVDTQAAGRLFSNPDPLDYVQEFSYSIPDDEYAADAPISIVLTNDRYKNEGIGFDRNVFVDFIEVNGLRFRARDLVLMKGGREISIDYQAGLLPIYETGVSVIANPPDSGWPGNGRTSGLTQTAGDMVANAGQNPSSGTGD